MGIQQVTMGSSLLGGINEAIYNHSACETDLNPPGRYLKTKQIYRSDKRAGRKQTSISVPPAWKYTADMKEARLVQLLVRSIMILPPASNTYSSDEK